MYFELADAVGESMFARAWDTFLAVKSLHESSRRGGGGAFSQRTYLLRGAHFSISLYSHNFSLE